MRRKSSRKQHALTLTELLVAVSIVFILVALSVPVLRDFRGRSKQMACMANLRHIYGGMAIYASDNDGYIPNGLATNLSQGFFVSGVDLPFALDSYSVDEFSFRCPMDTPTSPMGFGDPGYNSSYSYNGMMIQRLGESYTGKDHTCGPDEFALLTEGYVHWRGRANTLFHDGHVAARKF